MKPKANAALEVGSLRSFSAETACLNKKEERSERLTSSDSIIRLLLVDDHPVVRKGIISCLSSRANLAVVGEAADGLDALQKVSELSPDVVLMDVEMPNMNGLLATDTIRKSFPRTKVLILSMHRNADYVVQAIKMGARGFALKTSPSEDLIKAIEIVHRGEPFFPHKALSAALPSKKEPAQTTPTLFEREKEVLIHLAAGNGNREIADFLRISVRTVESHRARLMRKLNIHTIAGLTRYALAQGYISLNSDFPNSLAIEEPLRMRPAQGLHV